jgi:hypothetical protein
MVVAGSPDTISEVLRRAGAAGDRELFHPHDAILEASPFGEASYTLDAFIGDVVPAVRQVGLAPVVV